MCCWIKCEILILESLASNISVGWRVVVPRINNVCVFDFDIYDADVPGLHAVEDATEVRGGWFIVEDRGCSAVESKGGEGDNGITDV